MSRATSSARSTPATRWRSSSRPCPARPTSWWPGAATPRCCTTPANTTRSSPRASRSRPGCWPSCCEGIGVNARSWQGWQLPILTSNAHGTARILDVNGAELIKRFKERGEVAVIAGFQGMHKETGRITTLGPRRLGYLGGGDRGRDPGRALRHLHRRRRRLHHRPARGAEARNGSTRSPTRKCWSSPRSAPRSCRCARSSSAWCTMCASSCARASRSRRTSTRTPRRRERSSAARRRSWNSRSSPASPSPRTRRRSRSAACRTSPGVAAAIFGPLAEANINVDMIVQNVSSDGETTDLTFTVPAADYERALDVLAKARGQIGYDRLDGATDVAKVSVIGIGMRSHAGVAAQRVQGAGRRKHQHPRHHHLRDQVLAADRRRLYRVGGAHPALAVWVGQVKRKKTNSE